MMTRDDRDALARMAAWLKPGQHVEVSASNLRWLLRRADDADRLERATQDFCANHDEPRCAKCGCIVAVYYEDPSYCHECRP